jgi:hypothetical protein
MDNNRGKYTLPLFLAVLIGACGLVGFYELFSNFRTYDDEGLLMVSSQLFLNGHIFYKEIPWIYGPIQLATVQVLHGWLSVPITHSAVRFVTLAVWLVLSGVSSLLVYQLTRYRAWALVSFILAFLFTRSIVNEPGHPQGLVAFATILIPLIPCLFRVERKWLPWLLIGGMAAAVANIKLNAGIFCIAAVSVVLASQFRPARWRGLLQLAIAGGSLLFPFMLMYPLLADPNCRGFALITACSAAAVAVITSTREVSGIQPRSACLAFLVGLMVVTLGALAFAGQHGVSIIDILSSLLGYAASQIEYYHFFRDYSLFQLGMAIGSLVLAISFVMAGDSSAGTKLITVGKTCFSLAAVYAFIVNDAAHAQAMLGYAGPWCWLVALGRHGEPVSTGRLLLAATAAWAPLLAYPIPGSQIYFGSLPVLLAAIVCAVDTIELLPVASWRGYLPGRIASYVALFVALGLLGWHYKAARDQYRDYEPLGLPGTEFLRVEPRLAKVLRGLVDSVDSADVVLTTFRFNSLYLWSHVKPPVPGLLPLSPLRYLSAADQQRIKRGLQVAQHPVIVTRVSAGDALPPVEVLVWIDQTFEPYDRIGPYRLMRPGSAVSPGLAD